MSKPSVAIVGYGKVGRAYHKVFPNALAYDPHVHEYITADNEMFGHYAASYKPSDVTKGQVNQCDVAIVAVWTGLNKDGELDMSIVEEVVGWIACPLIIIKSALQPGTTDELVKKTGKKIAVSVEYVGEGNYHQPPHKYPDSKDPRKHQLLVVGGEEDAAESACEVLWRHMSPDIRIHKVTALEAEITKLAENTYGAMKVTWGNVLRDICEKFEVSFVRVHQAWSEDGRVDPMHTRSVSSERGWASKCYDKDVDAFTNLSDSAMLKGLIKDNKRHLEMNDDEKK